MSPPSDGSDRCSLSDVVYDCSGRLYTVLGRHFWADSKKACEDRSLFLAVFTDEAAYKDLEYITGTKDDTSC